MGSTDDRDFGLPTRRAAALLAVFVSLAVTLDSPKAKGSPAPAGGLVYPTHRAYPIWRVETLPDSNAAFDSDAWQPAHVASPLFENGLPEPPARRTTFRMLCAGDRLVIGIDCRDDQPDKIHFQPDTIDIWRDDSIEILIAQQAQPDFPYVHIQMSPGGALTVDRIPAYFAAPHLNQAKPLPADTVQTSTRPHENRWTAFLSLSVSKLGIPENGFYFNLVRNRHVDDSNFAWCDLWKGNTHRPELFGRAEVVTPPFQLPPQLAAPARLAVGLNALQLDMPVSGAKVRVGVAEYPCDDAGSFSVPVSRHGPVDLELLDAAGRIAGTYHADVPRPLLIEAAEPFVAEDAKRAQIDLVVATASDVKDVTITATRGQRQTEQRHAQVAPGVHRLTVDIPQGDADEVHLEARATVTTPQRSVTLRAVHWFVVGHEQAHFDRYRPKIRQLPTGRLYWAALADACAYYRPLQRGDGAYRTVGRGGRWRFNPWYQGMVYPIALLYATPNQDNPHHGDRRLLESAVLGMEYALDSNRRHPEHQRPDNRSLQAYLLAYELLRDRIEPERSAYWAAELTHRIEGTIRQWIHPALDKATLYSEQVGTGTNHWAYHLANVYLAGEVLDRPDWRRLGRNLMRRLAKHGAEGHFPERKGVPTSHYTWLTMNAVGQYLWRSGDNQVAGVLEHCAEFCCHNATPDGGVLVLHDGRNSHHSPFWFGDFVLSLTPHGRALARTRMLQIMRTRPSNVSPEYWFRCAENARYFREGPAQPLGYEDHELLFSAGVLARRHGFQYGLSTIAVEPIVGNYRLDPQNAVELFDQQAGCILHGGNSQAQPEAGSFFVRRDNQVDFLPRSGRVERVEQGHRLDLTFRSFRASVQLDVTHAQSARLTVRVEESLDDQPVTFNFFPGIGRQGDVEATPRELSFRNVRLTADRDIQLQRGFKTMDPYSLTYARTGKPVRAYVDLRPGQTLTLNVEIDSP
ncbi:MAG TPA: hypothetical protein VMZ31_01845 [Phycisphaerae bacterium]|nr:hypothetical protein [Phycisphaerae bacterium]